MAPPLLRALKAIVAGSRDRALADAPELGYTMAAELLFLLETLEHHPEWGEDKIAEELAAKFGIHHSGSTVRIYMSPRRRPPPDGQTWRTFVRNHGRELWACDFLTQYTATFTIAYVFVVMEIASRRIVHVNVTTAPTLAWVTQQLRNATPWGTTPRPRIHAIRRGVGDAVGPGCRALRGNTAITRTSSWVITSGATRAATLCTFLQRRMLGTPAPDTSSSAADASRQRWNAPRRSMRASPRS